MARQALLQSIRLADQVVDLLKQEILDGKLIPGSKLPTERELSERFGVSRTVIREATKSLEQSGLIVVQPGRGTFVVNQTHTALKDTIGLMMDSRASTTSIAQMIEFREILEPGIAALAAKNATPREILEMQAAVEIMDANLHDKEVYLRADNAFHLALAKATQNPIIEPVLDPFLDLLNIQRAEVFEFPEGPLHGQTYHKEILDAVLRHDPEAAEMAMKNHLRQVREDIEATKGELPQA